MIGCSPRYVMCCGSTHCASFFYVWMIKCWCLTSSTKQLCVPMNNTNRSWNILNWNIRGINSKDKWLALRQKIDESDCNILCLQETKRESFDTAYIKNFCPNRINKFAFLPSVGASGGLLVAWNGSQFSGEIIAQNRFSLSMQFTSLLSNQSWILSNIYGPCDPQDKMEFIHWFLNIHMPDDVDWILMGDFNLMRAPSDRNRPGGDVNDMLMFNEAISNQGLVELPLHGRKFSWSNMQHDPLLVKLDWFFTSASWMTSFPNTIVLPLAKPISDHLPCVIKVGTSIPKARVFRFENYWLHHSDFKQVVASAWSIPVGNLDSVKSLNAKFKILRRALKLWAKSLSCLKTAIAKLNELIFMWDFFEEFRELDIHE